VTSLVDDPADNLIGRALRAISRGFDDPVQHHEPRLGDGWVQVLTHTAVSARPAWELRQPSQ
jgi:hypothetical protein